MLLFVLCNFDWRSSFGNQLQRLFFHTYDRHSVRIIASEESLAASPKHSELFQEILQLRETQHCGLTADKPIHSFGTIFYTPLSSIVSIFQNPRERP